MKSQSPNSNLQINPNYPNTKHDYWLLKNWLLFGDWCLEFGIFIQFEPQVEQLVAEHPPQEELAVLLNLPPLEKAKADIIRLTFLLLHCGQVMFAEELRTSFSNS
jgi:hypothetical protein